MFKRGRGVWRETGSTAEADIAPMFCRLSQAPPHPFPPPSHPPPLRPQESLAVSCRQGARVVSFSASLTRNRTRHVQIGGIVDVRGFHLGLANCACNSSASNGSEAARGGGRKLSLDERAAFSSAPSPTSGHEQLLDEDEGTTTCPISDAET